MSIGGNWDRRRFLKASGAGAAGLVFGAGPYAARAASRPRFGSTPFTLGVASGDPTPDGAVLWTRLAPDPLAEDGLGGMPPRRVPVRFEVARDERFRGVVQGGTVQARPELGHAVHVEVRGLAPGSEYFYRFRAGSEESPAGRTRTTPAVGAPAGELTFAFCSCQQYEHGYYTAYRRLAEEGVDLVLHLGDYIYEYGPNEYVAPGGNVRAHNSAEITTLAAYRNRHALYRTDPDLQAAHAAAPWVVTWDDHEVENNYADEVPEKGQSPAAFVQRRAAAYQAYYEHMPLRRASVPAGPDMLLYRRVAYGDLAEFHVLDTRQYRDDQANDDGIKPPSPASEDPARTLMGAGQERWLLDGLVGSGARWNVLAQQVFFAQLDLGAGPGEAFNMDAWDGYPAARERVVSAIVAGEVANPVVLTGDVHTNWASDLLRDFRDPESAVVGAEFVGTSISSGGDGADVRADTAQVLAANPHVRFFNDQRGYVRCSVTPERWRADYRVVPYVSRPGAPVFTRASFVVEADRPGLQPAGEGPVSARTHRSDAVEADRISAQRRGSP
jgi:alkaline phosphatase D